MNDYQIMNYFKIIMINYPKLSIYVIISEEKDFFLNSKLVINYILLKY